MVRRGPWRGPHRCTRIEGQGAHLWGVCISVLVRGNRRVLARRGPHKQQLDVVDWRKLGIHEIIRTVSYPHLPPVSYTHARLTLQLKSTRSSAHRMVAATRSPLRRNSVAAEMASSNTPPAGGACVLGMACVLRSTVGRGRQERRGSGKGSLKHAAWGWGMCIKERLCVPKSMMGKGRQEQRGSSDGIPKHTAHGWGKCIKQGVSAERTAGDLEQAVYGDNERPCGEDTARAESQPTRPQCNPPFHPANALAPPGVFAPNQCPAAAPPHSPFIAHTLQHTTTRTGTVSCSYAPHLTAPTHPGGSSGLARGPMR